MKMRGAGAWRAAVVAIVAAVAAAVVATVAVATAGGRAESKSNAARQAADTHVQGRASISAVDDLLDCALYGDEGETCEREESRVRSPAEGHGTRKVAQ